MNSNARARANIAGFWGFGLQIVAPALAAVMLLAVAYLWVSDFALLRQAREIDMARVDRYAKFSKMVLESSIATRPVQDIINDIHGLRLDIVEFLPPSQPPPGPNVRFIPQQSLVEAWQLVNGPDGKPAGFVRIRRVDDSFRVWTAATRQFTAALALSGLVLCAVFVWTTRVLIIAKVKHLRDKIHALAPAAQRDTLPFSADPVASLASAFGNYAASVRKEREEHRVFLDRHTESACITTDQGILLEVNAAFCSILGKTRKELIGRSLLDLVPAADRTEAVHALHRLSAKNLVNVVEHRIVLPDGSLHWMRWRETALFDDSGEKRILAFGTDITREKELEAKTDGLQRAFDQMQSLARTGSLTWDLARDRMEWTAEAARLLRVDNLADGASLETLLGVVCPEHRETLAGFFRRARETGDPFEFEFCVGQPDKDRRYLQSRAEVRADPKTKLLTLLTCTLHDVTALREAESAKLRESMFREAVESAVGVGIVVLDKEGLPISANPSYLQMIGYTEDELRAMRPPYPFWPEEDLPAFEEALRLSLAGQSPPGGFELRFRHKDGQMFDVLINTVELRSESGEHLGYVSSITEITAIQKTRRKLAAAEALARKELAFREAIEKAFKMGVYVTDMSGNALSVNDGFAAMTGLTKEEIIAQKPPLSWWPEEELSNIKQAWKSVFISGKFPPDGLEMTFCRKDGTRFDVLDLLAPLRDAEGRQTGWISSVIDITKIQQTRRRLVEINEVLSVAAEVAEAGVWVMDMSFCRNEWSRRSFALHGDPDGRDPAETYFRAVPPAERERSDAYLRQVVESGESDGHNEMDVVWPDGSVHRISSHFRVIRDEKNGAIVIVGIHRDITGFIRREQELRSALERQRIAAESAGLGVWDWNPRTDKLTWDRRSFAIFGHPDGTDEEAVWQATISPEERDALTRKMKSLVAGAETSGSDSITLRWPDGQIRSVISNYSVIRNAEGEAVAVIGINRDVTAEEQRERNLRDANKRLTAALEGGQFGTFEHVIGVGDINWSPSNYKINGINPSITDPARLFEAWKHASGEFFPQLMARMNALPVSENHLTYEYTAHPAGREPRRVRTFSYIDRDAAGNPVRLVGITQRIG